MDSRWFWMAVISLFFLAAVPAAAEMVPGEVLESYELPLLTPTGLAFDGHNFWIADLESAQIFRVDPETGKILDWIDAPGYAPYGLAWDGDRLWCVDGGDKVAYAITPSDGVTVHSVELETSKPQGIGWDGKGLWIADAHAGKLIRIDGEDGTTIQTLVTPTAGANKRSEEIGVTFEEGFLWVADRMSDAIYQMDTVTGAVVNTFAAPGPYPAGLAWYDDALWCVDYERRTLFKLNTLCGGSYTTSGAKKESVVFREKWRNMGPGTVKTLDIFMAVPRDLPNQKLLAEPVFVPPPGEFLEDQWGQKIAHFAFKDIGPGEGVAAVMEVEAEIRAVRWVIDPEMAGSLEEVPQDLRDTYLVDESKLDMNSPVIQKAVKEAVGDETNAYWVAWKIYRYIQERMFYKLSGGWNVAPTVLTRGSGSCSEYTFVMVSMCRAAGLPARYQGSVVIRGDDASRDDVFHRWVEVYLPNYGWIPVDPSGGDSDVPADRAKYFGGLSNRFLITTVGGGASPYLGWGYNSHSKWTAKGRINLLTFRAGDWSPIDKVYEPGVASEAGGLGCIPAE